jgi:hypothetical protein
LVGVEAAQASTPLPWGPNPGNKTSGITVFDAEKGGYNVAFVTYLFRFLLSFDGGVANQLTTLNDPCREY